MKIVKYKILEKDDTYIGTAITDLAYAHIHRAFKRKNEEEVIRGVEVVGEAHSTEILQFLNKIDREWKILNTNVISVPSISTEKVEKLLKKIKEIEDNSEKIN